MSVDSAPAPVSVVPVASPVGSEQHLLRESERISVLLRRRRKATTYILALFIAAALAAGVVLYQFVRQQDAKINRLESELAKAGLAVRAQEAWVRSFEARSARADSLLDMHDRVMAQSERRSRAAADSLITDSLRSVHAQLMERTRDASDLRAQLGSRDPNLRRDLSRLDTRVNGLVQTADLRPILNRLSDSIGLLNGRVDRAHERYEYLNGRIDRLNQRIGVNPGDRATPQRGTDSSRARP